MSSECTTINLYVIDWSEIEDNCRDIGVLIAWVEYRLFYFATKGTSINVVPNIWRFLQCSPSDLKTKKALIEVAKLDVNKAFGKYLDNLDVLRSLNSKYDVFTIGEFAIEVLDVFKDIIIDDN